MANGLDCNLKVIEFILASCRYVYFRTNTIRKGMKLFIPVMDKNVSLLFIYKEGFTIRQVGWCGIIERD